MLWPAYMMPWTCPNWICKKRDWLLPRRRTPEWSGRRTAELRSYTNLYGQISTEERRNQGEVLLHILCDRWGAYIKDCRNRLCWYYPFHQRKNLGKKHRYPVFHKENEIRTIVGSHHGYLQHQHSRHARWCQSIYASHKHWFSLGGERKKKNQPGAYPQGLRQMPVPLLVLLLLYRFWWILSTNTWIMYRR